MPICALLNAGSARIASMRSPSGPLVGAVRRTDLASGRLGAEVVRACGHNPAEVDRNPTTRTSKTRRDFSMPGVYGKTLVPVFTLVFRSANCASALVTLLQDVHRGSCAC